MRDSCTILLILGCFLPVVIGDDHLICPEGRACPIGTSPRTDPSSGVCESNDANNIRNAIGQATTAAIGAYRLSNDDYFERLRRRYVGQNARYSAIDCDEIKRAFPESGTGYYWIGGRQAYCNFDLQTPASNKIGWERVLYVNMSDPSQNCPDSNFRLVQPPEDKIRYCVKRSTEGGCDSHVFSPATASFSRVFGRVIGIQIGTGDITSSSAPLTIDDAYLDGVSLTTNNNDARQHIWSLMSFTTETENGCPCSAGSPNTPLQFIGTDYFCESGASMPFTSSFLTMSFPDDPLWDGQQCGGMEGACCDVSATTLIPNSPPWFYREFGQPVASGTNLEIRLCTDQAVHDERIGVQLIELYVQ